jgi:hypothetical protein
LLNDVTEFETRSLIPPLYIIGVTTKFTYADFSKTWTSCRQDRGKISCSILLVAGRRHARRQRKSIETDAINTAEQFHRSLVLGTVRLCVCERSRPSPVRTGSVVILPAWPLPGAGRVHARGSRSSIDAIDTPANPCAHGAGDRTITCVGCSDADRAQLLSTPRQHFLRALRWGQNGWMLGGSRSSSFRSTVQRTSCLHETGDRTTVWAGDI